MTGGDVEAKAAFHMRLRAAGIRDLRVLRAFERISRDAFVLPRYGHLACRDIAVPLPCGQTLHAFSLAARMIEALAVGPRHRVLEIGAGSGYATAILGQLGREVLGVERFQTLAHSAQARLAELDAANVTVAWLDGLSLPPGAGLFDRILVDGVLPGVPATVLAHLAPDGVLVGVRPTEAGQIAFVYRGGSSGETAICKCRLQPILPGLAAS